MNKGVKVPAMAVPGLDGSLGAQAYVQAYKETTSTNVLYDE